MSATFDTIWQVPAYLPYIQPPLTDAAVDSAERKIGYKLPTECLNLLKNQNGGYIRYSLPQMVHNSIAGIGPHFPSLTGFDWDESQEYVSFSLNGLIPFDGDGHWHRCLDYRQQSDAPAVTYLDIECDQESPIATSFVDYLGKIRIGVGEEYVVEGLTEIENLKSELAATLGIAFEPPNSDAHGYPMHRGRLGTGKNTQWVWISPNTTSRGFIRPNHARYAELKDLLPGLASRFPEAPADGYILSMTDSVRGMVVDACVHSGRIIRPLRQYLIGS